MTHQTRTATDIDRAASQIAGCLWDDREQTGTLAEQLRACADTTPTGTDGDLTSEDRQALRDLADEAEALDSECAYCGRGVTEREPVPAFDDAAAWAALATEHADDCEWVRTRAHRLDEAREARCAICAASGVETWGWRDTMTEIIRDATRDGLGAAKVYACDHCIAAGTDEDRDEMGVTADEWAVVQARR